MTGTFFDVIIVLTGISGKIKQEANTMSKTSIKKYVAEAIGTCVLVLVGCGTAMLTGCVGAGYLTTAFAFGLVIVGMAYCIGNISGCHINPAVSLAVWLNKGLSNQDFIGYIAAQCAGSLVGTALLRAIFALGDITDNSAPKGEDWGMGANGIASLDDNILAGLLVEVILTFIFVMVILGVTSKKANHGSFGGLIIGLSLTMVHILGIGLTGTSVNPARSLWPAVFAMGDAIKYVWIFILAPFAGSALAAFTYKWLESDEK